MKKLFYLYHKRLVLIFLFVISLVFSVVAVQAHNHFLTFGWDLGYFDQVIYLSSRFSYPLSTLSGVNILAGHFAPVLFLFVPLYWILPDARSLLVAQSFIVVFAGFPLYLLAFSKTKHRLFSFSVVFSYIFFLGTQWTILNEFHEASISPLFISLIFLGLCKNKKSLFWAGLIGLLSVKEEMFLLAGAIGLSIFFFFKKRKLGALIFSLSIFFFFFLTNFFMPAISEKGIYQHPHISDTASTPSQFAVKIISDPLFAAKSLITPFEKMKTLFWSLFSFGFLPIFAPVGILISLAEQFLLRFLYTGPQFTMWQNVNHHSAPSAMLLSVCTIYAVPRIRKVFRLDKKQVLVILSVILFSVTLFQDLYFKAPVHSVFKKQLYESSSWMEDNYLILSEMQKLPFNTSIAVQNSLFPHLSQRQKIYLLPEIHDAEYVVADLHNGPNKYSPLNYEKMIEFLGSLEKDGDFEVYKRQGKAVIYKRSSI